MVFNKGDKPGPGRGKKKIKENDVNISDRDLFELLEEAIKKGLTAKDLSDQLVAARAGINLQKLKGPVETGQVLSPVLVDGFKDGDGVWRCFFCGAKKTDWPEKEGSPYIGSLINKYAERGD